MHIKRIEVLREGAKRNGIRGGRARGVQPDLGSGVSKKDTHNARIYRETRLKLPNRTPLHPMNKILRDCTALRRHHGRLLLFIKCCVFNESNGWPSSIYTVCVVVYGEVYAGGGYCETSEVMVNYFSRKFG